MCRLAGVISKQESIDWNILVKMLDHQKAGGPDGQGIWQDGNIGISHNRLAIIDLSKNGAQPMECDRWVLSYVGEIYNYRELQKHISVRQWKSYNDTETLLFLIDEKGVEATLDLVSGMFAFAAYDKIENVLWLAVDPMGIKPMYYYHDDNLFAFASSPAALTYCKDKWGLNFEALMDYLALGATYESLFTGIKKLMPGTVMRREASGKTGIKKYYKPLFYADITEADLLGAVTESIESVKVADVPVSLFLSGGIDSTVIASHCQFINAIHLDGPEKQYAQAVSKRYNLALSVISPQDANARQCLEDYARQSGDCSAAAIVPYMVSREVAKKYKVAISANGSDELFFGYDRMSNDVTQEQFRHIFREHLATGHWTDAALKSRNSRELELTTYVQFDLNKTLDFASMCHGLEIRVPFLNRKVVDMALSLPMDKHVRGHRRKVILKDYLHDQGFDSKFTDRAKIGFSLFSQPIGYEDLKLEGVKLLADRFGIAHDFQGRDKRYFQAAAAAFLCWLGVWSHKLLI